MVEEIKKDWKEFLAPEDEELLNDLLKRVAKYRGAYKNAEDPRIAQLWGSDTELFKAVISLQKRISFIEDIIEATIRRMEERDRKKLELVKSLEKF